MVAPTHKRSTPVFVLGILSIVCFGLLAGIPGIILGRKGLKDVAASGGQLRVGLLKAGFILSIIGTVLSLLGVVFIGIAAATGLFDDSGHAKSSLAREALSESDANQFPGKLDEAGSKCFGDAMVSTFGVDTLTHMGFLDDLADASNVSGADLRITEAQATTIVHKVLMKCDKPGSLKAWVQDNVHGGLEPGTASSVKACIDEAITDEVANKLAVVALSNGDISSVEDPIVGPCLKH